jgi:hypothetical protein
VLEVKEGDDNKMGAIGGFCEFFGDSFMPGKSHQNRMSDDEFEKWIQGFQSDFSTRQKEVIAKLAWLRCRQTFGGNKVMNVKLRRCDCEDI